LPDRFADTLSRGRTESRSGNGKFTERPKRNGNGKSAIFFSLFQSISKKTVERAGAVPVRG
jgi:hypothetical protein